MLNRPCQSPNIFTLYRLCDARCLRTTSRALALRLQHRFGHLLHEQQDAIGALDDVLPNVWRQQFVADNAVDHSARIALRQPIDGESGDVRPIQSKALRTPAGTSRSVAREGPRSGPLPDRPLQGS
jgi:hypothetical protein